MGEQSQIIADGEVLPGVAGGSNTAMNQCITRYGGLVWSIARRYVRDRGAAEDVVQETFTDIWKSAKRYDPAIATECTFIGILARRRAIDWVRKQNRQPLFESLPEADPLPHVSDDPSPALACESGDVRKALGLLPEDTRELFTLHFDQGLTHPEIAEKTGTPLGTVKTRLRRGLIELRNHLRRLEGGAQPAPADR
ncbi:MAG: sigma-70 family RNA polymerase sigma factor [Akkermansiaceae bacterium]|nr:sigma-70 family RNA polymerase sigma factor [Akkermansiaceae bacterium]